MDRSEKESQVNALRLAFETNNLLVITHMAGLTVAEASDLRRQMRDAGATFRVTKNRLAKIAIKGSKFEQLANHFIGPTAIAVSEDPVAAARVVYKFADTNGKLVIRGGALDEKELDAAGIAALAVLPSLDDLRGKFLAILQAPAEKIARVIQAPASQLARIMNAQRNLD